MMHLWQGICRLVLERIQMFRIIVDRYARSSGPRGRHDSSVKFRLLSQETLGNASRTGHRFLVIVHATILQANFVKIIYIKNLRKNVFMCRAIEERQTQGKYIKGKFEANYNCN